MSPNYDLYDIFSDFSFIVSKFSNLSNKFLSPYLLLSLSYSDDTCFNGLLPILFAHVYPGKLIER